MWIGYGVDEKVSDWIRIAKFPYPYTTSLNRGARDDHLACLP